MSTNMYITKLFCCLIVVVTKILLFFRLSVSLTEYVDFATIQLLCLLKPIIKHLSEWIAIATATTTTTTTCSKQWVYISLSAPLPH